MSEKVVGKHFFELSNGNSGEGLTLETNIFDNGDDSNNIFLNQSLVLQSYCNSAQFNLIGDTLTPDKLKKLANELEKEINKYSK